MWIEYSRGAYLKKYKSSFVEDTTNKKQLCEQLEQTKGKTSGMF